jgi:3'-phosphoadenosine 5'-phosphosulfate sulfotransferase (PAPS reductase)/FAD synthetase
MNESEANIIANKLSRARERIHWAIDEFSPIAVFGLFSGGHDSLSATFCASPFFNFAVHINTGIGVQRTRQFVQDTCKIRGWPLLELKASDNVNATGQPDPQRYRDFVLKYGFPGPHGHGMMYARLKERALNRLARMFGATTRGASKRRIMLISGCRSQESTRRMGTVDEVQIRGRFIWAAPIHDWSKLDTTLLIEHAGLERNPVVDLIHKSGECLCGAFAKPGELEELALWPETKPAYDQIKSLEAEAAVAGVHCKWGTRPLRERKSSHTQLELLCWSCAKQS